MQHWEDTVDGGQEGVDLVESVVYGETGADGAGDAIAIHDRLGAVMSGADSDAKLVDKGAHIVGVGVADKEREHGGLVRCSAEDAHAG